MPRKERLAKMTPEQRERDRASKRKHPDETAAQRVDRLRREKAARVEGRRERRNERARRYYENRSPEQCAKRAAYKRLYNAANREFENEQRYLARLRRIDEDPVGAIAAERASDKARRERLKVADPDRFRRIKREKQARKRAADPVKFREKERRRYLRHNPLSPAAAAQLFEQARNATPGSLPADVREEIVAEVIAAFYRGKLTRKFSASDVKPFITEHFRQFSKFTTISLDDVVGDGATRGQLMGVY